MNTRRRPPFRTPSRPTTAGARAGLADGIVITPSHNPPDSGGFKYNPPDGGPADTEVTAWMEARANELLKSGLTGVRRMGFAQARRAATTHSHDFMNAYVADLGQRHRHGSRSAVRAFAWASIRSAAPACTTGARIAERYKLDLNVVNDEVDPTFRFMSLDWDGKIRMDPSSPYAMRRLIGLKDRLRHRVRLRHRSRPARHRDRERRIAAAQPLPVGGRRLSVPASAGGGSRRPASARPSSAAP